LLTDSGYFTALGVYLISAVLALLLMNLWVLRGRGMALRVLITLPLAALLLTPAYIEPGAETFAPAVIVAAFQWLAQGPEAAQHALRPLGLFTGGGFAVGVFLAVILVWRGRNREVDAPRATA
jgi:hypothetical protein